MKYLFEGLGYLLNIKQLRKFIINLNVFLFGKYEG